MARWRLTQAHYINVEGTEWEYKEVDNNGRQRRKTYPVPLFLDPKDAADFNGPGGIYVSDGDGAGPNDHIFSGPPTIDMEPLDEAAEALSAPIMAACQHPINSLAGNMGEDVMRTFMDQMRAVQATSAPTSPIPGPSMDQFNALQDQLTKLAEQNAALIAQLGERNSATRRL